MLAITCFATGAYMLSRNLDMTHDAVAATSGSTVYSVTCNAVTQQAWVPSAIAATVEWTTTIGALPTCAVSAVVTGSVANDVDPTNLGCLLYATSGNFIEVRFISPAMKMTGLQCQTAVAGVQLAANAVADAGPNLEIYFDAYESTTVGDSGTNKVDQTASRMLFGADGTIKGSDLLDGSDFDTLINGEVQFGKTTGTAHGGADGTSKTKMGIDQTNNTSIPAETVTFTFTAGGA